MARSKYQTWDDWYEELLNEIDWLYENTEGQVNDYIHDVVKTLQDVIKDSDETKRQLESAEDRLWNEVDSKFDREY